MSVKKFEIQMNIGKNLNAIANINETLDLQPTILSSYFSDDAAGQSEYHQKQQESYLKRLISMNYDPSIEYHGTPESEYNYLNLLSTACSYTYNVSTKTFSSTGIYNPLDRINIYLLYVSQFLNNVNEIVTDQIPQPKIELSSIFTDFSTPVTNFKLTQFNTYNELTNTFSLLSSFVDKSYHHVFDRRLESSFSFDIRDHVLELLNQQNVDIVFDNIDPYNQDFLIQRHISTTLINYYDMLYILNLFIQRLKNIKYVIYSMSFWENSVNTKFIAHGKLTNITTSTADDTTRDGIPVQLVLSNISQQKGEISRRTVVSKTNFITTNRKHYIDDVDFTSGESVLVAPDKKINLGWLIYDVSSGASMLDNLPVDGTNGIFGYNIKTTKYDIFNLNIQTIQDMFDIKPNVIIKRKNVLNAIDYIFNYWIENISYNVYSISLCHCNCHTNAFVPGYYTELEFGTPYTIQTAVNLYNNGGCGCGGKICHRLALKDIMTHRSHLSDPSFPSTLDVRVEVTVMSYSENSLRTDSPAPSNISYFYPESTDLQPIITFPPPGYSASGEIPSVPPDKYFTIIAYTEDSTKTKFKKKQESLYFDLYVVITAHYTITTTITG